MELENISDIFDPNRLRTVSNFRDMLSCPFDAAVVFELKDDALAKLTFPYPWDGRFYAYYLTDVERPADKWFIADWGNGLCRLTLERRKQIVAWRDVSTDDVLQLLELCLRIPAQRNGRKEK